MRNQHVSILEWIIVFILLTIPIVNVILILILALGSFSPSLKNFAKAVIFSIIFGVLLMTIFSDSLGNIVRHYPFIW